MDHSLIKTPRLYIDQPLKQGGVLNLNKKQSHYLKTVLRKQDGENIRLFNGQDGEWVGILKSESKKEASLVLEKSLKEQPLPPTKRALLFAPIKKQRMDFLIEKAVELGVTDLMPVITQRTEVRKINKERLNAQIIEAAEQCERLDLPTLHPANDIMKAVTEWDKNIPLFWACERSSAPILNRIYKDKGGFLIGPEGGFTDHEIETLHKLDHITAISLGSLVLRAETAALACLALTQS